MKHTLSNSVILNSNDKIYGNGTISGNLILEDNTSFAWRRVFVNDDVQLTGSITMEDNTTFDFGDKTLSASVNVIGDDAFIRDGTLSGGLTIGADNSLELSGNLTGTGIIYLPRNRYSSEIERQYPLWFHQTGNRLRYIRALGKNLKHHSQAPRRRGQRLAGKGERV